MIWLKRLVILMCLCSVPGCTMVAPNIIGPAIELYLAWKAGEAVVYYACDSLLAYNAMKRTLNDLHYVILKDEPQKDPHAYYILAKNGTTGSQFKINITQVGAMTTRVGIRVDLMGDHPYAEMIFRHLNKELDVIIFDPKNRDSRHFWQRAY